MAACISEQVSSASTNTAKKSVEVETTNGGKPLCWQHRLFGKQLVRCSQINARDAKKSINTSTSSSLVNEDNRPVCEIIGVYFTFVNPDGTCDDFTRQLAELYASVNSSTDNGERERRKKFEVVHVVLCGNVIDVCEFEESFRAHVADLPWLTVANYDYERKVSIQSQSFILSIKYYIV